jgi:hypothetical protein
MTNDSHLDTAAELLGRMMTAADLVVALIETPGHSAHVAAAEYKRCRALWQQAVCGGRPPRPPAPRKPISNDSGLKIAWRRGAGEKTA